MTTQGSALLEVRDVTVRFGGLLAVDHLSLAVGKGGIVGLIGPNGAGKTTLVDAITGFVKASGSVSLSGQEVGTRPAHDRARRGIGRTWQSAELFDDLSVRDNLGVSHEPFSYGRVLRDLLPVRRRSRAETLDALDLVGLSGLASRPARELSTGQRRLVGLARALANAPKVLCMDEPAAGLDETESARLAVCLRQVIDSDIGVLLIDHDMPFVMSVCDYVYVMNEGRLIAEGPPDEIVRNPDVIEAYLGFDHADPKIQIARSRADPGIRAAESANQLPTRLGPGLNPPVRSKAHGSELLRVEGLSAGYGSARAISDLSITVNEGDVVALFGPNGAGKTTSLLTISGLIPPLAGRVELFGKPMTSETPTQRARLGLAHVPEDRCLFHGLSVEDNLRLGARAGNRDYSEVLAIFPDLGRLLKRRAGLLSGGEQQMLTIARALLGRPRLLLVDELSLGLAPILASSMLALIRGIADSTGCGVLLVEQHVDLALSVADRGCAIAHGAVLMSGTADELRAKSGELTAGYLHGPSTPSRLIDRD